MPVTVIGCLNSTRAADPEAAAAFKPYNNNNNTMGGGGRSRTQRKHFRQSRENVWKRSKSDHSDPSLTSEAQNQNPPWTPFSTQNPSFDAYYKEQGIVGQQEWDEFVALLRTPLPATFRINSRCCNHFSFSTFRFIATASFLIFI